MSLPCHSAPRKSALLSAFLREILSVNNISKAVDSLRLFVYFRDIKQYNTVMYFSLEEAMKRSFESSAAEVNTGD